MATVIVAVPEVVTEVGLKVAVAPVGNPLALNVTVPVKPFCAVTLGVYVVLLPWTIVRELGVAVSVKFGAALTTSVAVALCVRLPLVPVIVIVYVPVGVLEAVVTLSAEDPEPVTEVGLNVPVAPVGSPVTLNVTAPLKPLNAPTVAV